MSVRPSTPPGGAGGTVFKGDAGLGQLLADGVGLGEVPSLAGSQSGVDQCLDRIIVEIALMSCCAAQSVAAHCDRILPQQPQHGGQAAQLTLGGVITGAVQIRRLL